MSEASPNTTTLTLLSKRSNRTKCDLLGTVLMLTTCKGLDLDEANLLVHTLTSTLYLAYPQILRPFLHTMLRLI